MSQRKLKSLTVYEKLRIIQAVNEGNQRKKDVAANFGIPFSTLSTILKNEAEILRLASEGRLLCKRKREADYPDIETHMVKWLNQCREENTCLKGPMLREKAEHFAKLLGHETFKASNGWLENFKKRQNIVFKNMWDERVSVSGSFGEGRKSPVNTVPVPSISSASSCTESPQPKRNLTSYSPTAKDLLKKATHYLEMEDDECLTLAKAYATKLRKLTPDQLMFADKVINDTLLDAQMGLLTKNTHLVHSLTSSSPETSKGSSHFINSSETF